MFQKLVVDDGFVKITDISEKQDSKSRPSGLNTVNLLKVSCHCICCDKCTLVCVIYVRLIR